MEYGETTSLEKQASTDIVPERHLGLIEKVMKMLSTAKGVDILTTGELKEDHGEREEIKILLDLCQRIKNQSQVGARS